MKNRTGYMFKRGHTYYVRWVVDGKAFVRTTGKNNVKDAEAERDRIMAPYQAKESKKLLEGIAEQIAGIDADLDSRKPPLAAKDAWKAYERAKNRPQSGDRTLEGYAGHYRRFSDWLAEKHPAAVELRDVDRAIADAYADDMTKAKFKASTYNQHIKLLDLVWSVLRDSARITLNPWAWDKKTRTGMARMKLDKATSRHAPLEPEQVNQIIELAEGDLKDLYVLLAYTGQRLTDCVHLRWENINFSAKIIKLVQRKMARRGEGEPVLIPLLPPVDAMLENRRRDGEYVCPALVELYSRDGGSTLAKRMGQVLGKANLTRTRTDVNGGRSITAFGSHSFRHAFVTNARAYGIPDAVIAKITGHRTDEMLDHYTAFSAKLVSALAKKAGQTKIVEAAPLALPAAADKLAKVRELISTMTAQNWKAVKSAIAEAAS